MESRAVRLRLQSQETDAHGFFLVPLLTCAPKSNPRLSCIRATACASRPSRASYWPAPISTMSSGCFCCANFSHCRFTRPPRFAAFSAKTTRCWAWSLGSHYPAYVSAERRAQLSPGEASLGLFIHSTSGSRLGYMPAVPEIDDGLLQQLDGCDVLLFDGTFWSDDELIRIQGSTQTARQMGHIPVESALVKLAAVRRPRKIFVHINNTNPMLEEASPEHRRVRDAGWEIAEDGWQFDL